MKTLKLAFSNLSRKFILLPLAVSSLVMMSIPSFAADDISTGVLPADTFEPMVTAVTSNIGAVLPKVLILAGLIIGIGVAVMIFKKFAK